MRVLRQVLGKFPSGSRSRVRNFVANPTLGTERSDIHENVLGPGAVVPWHLHAAEEVILVLEGKGECLTEQGAEPYRAGDVLLLPARVKHSLRNTGEAPLRQICFFPDDPRTERLEPEQEGQTVETYNAADTFEAEGTSRAVLPAVR
ncbi:cupin domain-containing protein [Falsiroseomonas sp. HW251]|uniref:cupin domain-containing protein n=1 Tax=Falsiroseomonas sp. HW251 TaxID=3390998 RepID=UPI003D31284F